MATKVTVFGNGGDIIQVIDIKTGPNEMEILRMILAVNDRNHLEIS